MKNQQKHITVLLKFAKLNKFYEKQVYRQLNSLITVMQNNITLEVF